MQCPNINAIIQEFANAKDVIVCFESTTLPWDTFTDTIKYWHPRVDPSLSEDELYKYMIVKSSPSIDKAELGDARTLKYEISPHIDRLEEIERLVPGSQDVTSRACVADG